MSVRPEGADRPPPLSVVVATTRPWPELRGTLDSLLDQARAVGAEVIVADRDGAGLPALPAFADVIRVHEPGASVFRLRALGLARARGDVVAVTEDHCRVRPGWCAEVLESHRRHPSAGVVGGVVENGATGRLLDWAHFLVSNGPFMAPVRSGARRRVSGQANLSYKRRALPAEIPALGVMEMLYTRRLRAAGERLVVDDRLVVAHVQSLGFARTCASHYHNGRSIAGFRRARMRAPERCARLAGTALLPPFLLARTLGAVLAKRRAVGVALASLPLMGLLVCCHAAGELVGYVSGPGTSPAHLN
ncbi:MAG TPA: glycosyltransferase [Candidatus Binatia bacterium]|nr:glycosyltransferase [Candidatus Binatia bacterium]